MVFLAVQKPKADQQARDAPLKKREEKESPQCTFPNLKTYQKCPKLSELGMIAQSVDCDETETLYTVGLTVVERAPSHVGIGPLLAVLLEAQYLLVTLIQLDRLYQYFPLSKSNES